VGKKDKMAEAWVDPREAEVSLRHHGPFRKRKELELHFGPIAR